MPMLLSAPLVIAGFALVMAGSKLGSGRRRGARATTGSILTTVGAGLIIAPFAAHAFA